MPRRSIVLVVIQTIITGVLFSFLASAVDLLDQAESLIKAEHFKRARAILEAEYQSNPKNPRTLYLLSEVREAFGKLDEALQLAEAALAIDQRNADYHYQVALISGELAQKANVFRQMSLAKRTKKEAETAIQLDPKHIDARSLLVTFHLEAPGIVGGDKKQAHELVTELAQLDPVEAASAELEIAKDQKNAAAIEAAIEKQARVGPRSYNAQVDAANYFAADNQRKYDIAEKYAKAAQRIDSNRAGAYIVLAGIFASTGRLLELEELLAEAETNVPDNLNPYFEAGRVLQERRIELPRAESYLRKYLTQEPEAGAPGLDEAKQRLKRIPGLKPAGLHD